MTIAEIRGKISRSGSNLSDRMEDLLTSDVFGPLRYLPFAEGLMSVLGKAKLYTNPDTTLDAKIGADFSDCTDEPEVCFWLRMENSEPDVLIKWGSHLVMIEAKYLSGKSGDSDSGDAESATPDQLAREFHDLSMYEEGKFPNRTLIYLTAHSTLPQDDLENSCKAVGEESEENKKKFEQNTYWLSWFDVRNAVEDLSGKQKDPHRELVLADISCLLHQKGFRGFEGFGKIKRMIERAKVRPVSGNIFFNQTQEKTMTSNDQDMTDNVKNSFDIVAKIYEETSFLLKDFSKEITGLGFDKEMLNEGIGTHRSTSIDYPKQWPVRYASWFFKHKDQENNEPYVCITAIFCDEDGEPIIPYLVTGVIETSWKPRNYWVLYYEYLNAKDKFEGKDGKFVELDGKGSVKGSVIAQPLLQINSAEEVKNLAKRMVDCWTEKFGEV